MFSSHENVSISEGFNSFLEMQLGFLFSSFQNS